MSAEKTLALVIRLVEFSESSYVATLFTEDFGKITGLAKGARRAKGPFENALDLLAVSRVVFLRKSTGAMDLLTEAKLERRFRAASRELQRLYAGYYVAELLQSLTDERDPHPELFRTAKETVEGLDQRQTVAPLMLRFELAMLRELGHDPRLDACVECGRSLPATGRVAFGPLAGGALCDRCRIGQRQVVSLSHAGLELMQRLARNGPLDEQELNDRRWIPVYGELRGLMNNVISHRLGRRPRMFPYMASWSPK